MRFVEIRQRTKFEGYLVRPTMDRNAACDRKCVFERKIVRKLIEEIVSTFWWAAYSAQCATKTKETTMQENINQKRKRTMRMSVCFVFYAHIHFKNQFVTATRCSPNKWRTIAGRKAVLQIPFYTFEPCIAMLFAFLLLCTFRLHCIWLVSCFEVFACLPLYVCAYVCELFHSFSPLLSASLSLSPPVFQLISKTICWLQLQYYVLLT